MGKIRFKINELTCEGCSCGHCGKPLIDNLKSENGIQSLDTDYENNLLTIAFDSTILNKQKLVALIEKGGYTIGA